jgi:hypothetical protein
MVAHSDDHPAPKLDPKASPRGPLPPPMPQLQWAVVDLLVHGGIVMLGFFTLWLEIRINPGLFIGVFGMDS